MREGLQIEWKKTVYCISTYLGIYVYIYIYIYIWRIQIWMAKGKYTYANILDKLLAIKIWMMKYKSREAVWILIDSDIPGF